MKNSNVAIDQATNEALSEFCTRTKLTKKDFITVSLKYFNDYAINPSKHEKPTQEIEKMHKRIEDIFKFSKAQERDILKPFLVQVAENNIKNRAEMGAVKNAINDFFSKTTAQHAAVLDQERKAHQEQLAEMKKINASILESQARAFAMVMELGERLEEKNKGLWDKFK